MTKIINGNIVRESLSETSYTPNLNRRRHSMSVFGDQRLRKIREIKEGNGGSIERGVEEIDNYFKDIRNNYQDFVKANSNKLQENSSVWSRDYWKLKLRPLNYKAQLYSFDIKLGYLFFSMIFSFIFGGPMYLLIVLLLIYLGTQYSQFVNIHNQKLHHNQPHHHHKNTASNGSPSQLMPLNFPPSPAGQNHFYNNHNNNNNNHHLETIPDNEGSPSSPSKLSASTGTCSPRCSPISKSNINNNNRGRRGSFTTLSDLKANSELNQQQLEKDHQSYSSY